MGIVFDASNKLWKIWTTEKFDGEFKKKFGVEIRKKNSIPRAEKVGLPCRIKNTDKCVDTWHAFYFSARLWESDVCPASAYLIGFSLLIHCLDKIALFLISLKASIIASTRV